MLRQSCSALLLATALGGCVFHMDHLVPASASTFDEALVGTWVSGKDFSAVVTRRGAAEYDIDYTEKGERLSFRATRGEVGGQAILELRPAAADEIDGWPTTKMVMVIRVDGDSATTQIIDKDALRRALARDGDADFFEQDGSLILTGDDGALKAVLQRHLGTAGMLEPGQAWRRTRR